MQTSSSRRTCVSAVSSKGHAYNDYHPSASCPLPRTTIITSRRSVVFAASSGVNDRWALIRASASFLCLYCQYQPCCAVERVGVIPTEGTFYIMNRLYQIPWKTTDLDLSGHLRTSWEATFMQCASLHRVIGHYSSTFDSDFRTSRETGQ